MFLGGGGDGKEGMLIQSIRQTIKQCYYCDMAEDAEIETKIRILPIPIASMIFERERPTLMPISTCVTTVERMT